MTEHSVGGGPDGGAVVSLAIVATRPATVFAAFMYGGVFKSADHGATWTPADRGLPAYAWCDLLADVVDPAVLYAECGGGLFKTVNGGSSWRQLDVDDAVLPVVAPSDPRVLYEPPGFHVVRSQDGGRHWESIEAVGSPSCQYAFAIDPSNPSVLYCGFDGTVNTSRDAGVTWSPTGRGLPRSGDDDLEALVIDPADPRTMYAATPEGGLYKTTTAGALWFPVGDSRLTAGIEQLIFSDRSGEVLFARHEGTILRSVDAGDHWQAVGASEDDGTGDFVVDPFSSSTIYRGTDAGVLVTTDLGAHWALRTRGITRTTAEVVLHDGEPPALFAKANGSTSTSSDAGASWRSIAREAFPEAGTPTPAESKVARLWSSASNGLPGMPGATAATVASVDPNDSETIYVVVKGVGIDAHGDLIRRTMDGGASWTELELPLAVSWTVVPTVPTTLLAQVFDLDRDHPGRYTLLRSTDRGERWTSSAAGLPSDVEIANIAADPRHPTRLFAGTRGRGVFRSVDGGVTWQPTGLMR